MQDVFCKWRIEAGSEQKWRHLSGDISGRSWLAERRVEEEVAEWNEPLDFSFACTSLQGWPKLFIQVFSVDSYNRIDLAGYAWCYIPTQPGRHVIEIPAWRPRGSFWEGLASFFLGGTPRYVKPEVVMKGDSRFGHRCISTGVIEVEMNVVLKGFPRHVELSPPDESNVLSSVCDGCYSLPKDTNDGVGEGTLGPNDSNRKKTD